MKDREDTIAFAMNYCQHYAPNEQLKLSDGRHTNCRVGQDTEVIQKQPIPGKAMKWGPCIEGHLLPNACEVCPMWLRTTREAGEQRADSIESAMRKLTIAGPFIGAWRKKEPRGKIEVVECPVCKGKLHLSQSSYNGHVHAHCETDDCISFME